MYVIKNAFRCIFRAKGRNFLIGLVVLLLSVSACIGLSIKEANKTLKKQYADDMEITASVNSNSKGRDRNISLDKLTELSNDTLVKDFNYSSSVYFAAGEGKCVIIVTHSPEVSKLSDVVYELKTNK